MYKSCLFGLYELHYIEEPEPELVAELIKDYTVYPYKFGYPNLSRKIVNVHMPYVELYKYGEWCFKFFNGVFYRKWFWRK